MERQGSPEDTYSDAGETGGLQESMWQVGLGSDPYPERPGEADCIYYLRTGTCGYGDRCRFNHPRHRPLGMGGRRVGGGDYPDRAGQPLCQYYMRTGTCKFGSSCKYHHPKQGATVVDPFALNVYGYPMRPGEKECSYYMKTGQCKFGMTCKFHHPQPANVQMPTAIPQAVSPAHMASPSAYSHVHNAPSPPVPQQYGVVTSNWPVARPPMMPGSYIQGPYGPLLFSPGVVPLPGWATYPPPSPLTPGTTLSAMRGGQLYGMTSLSPQAPAYTGSYQPISTSVGPSSSTSKEHTFPLRPGQPECQYYLKTGDCKFGLSCKYHHPAEWVIPETSSALSPMGLPLRVGTPTCSYYLQHGVCKFGPTCKFDHPMGSLSYSPSTSSLSDMPVAPYPVGSSVGTLAPSSSSSDLQPESVSGSVKDSQPILSSASISSKTGSISQSNPPASTTSASAPHSDPSK